MAMAARNWTIAAATVAIVGDDADDDRRCGLVDQDLMPAGLAAPVVPRRGSRLRTRGTRKSEIHAFATTGTKTTR
jgi:hypothetical protein